jgi:C1A family cysteine protease
LQERLNRKGAKLSKTLEALSLYGCCLDIDWPFIASRENKEPNILAIQKAEQYRLQEYEELSTINFKEYLNQDLPVIVGMNIGRQFLKVRGSIHEHTYTMISDTNRFSRGHAVTIVGYNDNLSGGSWIIANSMGLKWGEKGFGAISYDSNIDMGEAFVIKNFAGKTVEKKFPIIDK